jgi:N-methylhydantoinase A
VRAAVDIGGTFTDIVVMSGDGILHESKVSTTPDDPSRAVVAGLQMLLAELGVAASLVEEVLHGTTVGSNTILQRSGARTGLITTRGFRDVLEIGRIRMPDMFDLTWDKPKPLVPRRHRLEVTERIAADCAIVEPLSEASVIAAGEQLVAADIEAVAICLINSYRNPSHEQRVEALLRERFPKLLLTASYAVLPERKEYERTSTTVVNAYLLGAMRGYLRSLESGLRSIGIEAPIRVITSNGGMLAADTACEKPVFVVASGPAGGVIGAARLGAARAEPDLIVFDMGGTTAKAVIIEDGRPSMTSEYEFRDGISTSSRFVKAGGYMLKVPAIDIAEVGAGGGSLAGIDKGGLLKVGPESAGAVPGPACYGLGNERPTVTDANVVLTCGRTARHRPAPQRAGDPGACGQAARPVAGGRRARHPRHCQRRHVARHPCGDGGAGPRSPRSHADRHRRQRRHPRARRGARPRHRPRGGAATRRCVQRRGHADL